MYKALKKIISASSENYKVILRLLEKDGSARVCDLGCAEGRFSVQVARTIGVTEITGVDVKLEFDYEKENSGFDSKISIIGTNAELNDSLPFENERFDVIIASQVIEHIPNTDIFVKEIYRILAPGGYAIVSTPNLAAAYEIFWLILGLQPFTEEVSNEVSGLGNRFNSYYMRERRERDQSHLRSFTLPAIRDLFLWHGFKIEKLLGVGYYPFPLIIGKLLASIDPRHAAYLTIKVRK